MPKLLSNRKPVFPPNKLTDDRFKYLGLSQAQPALGEAPTQNEGYTIQTDGTGKATFSDTLGQLKFVSQNISTTLPGDMTFTNTNGNIVISPYVKAQINGNFEVEGDILVKGKNPLGTAPVVSNVLYVTMDGDDKNDGRAMDATRACRTISGAVRSPYYQEGTVIKVSSGHYYEENPIPLKGYTCVIGDDLRTVFIEPLNRDQDLFHVNSGVYVAQMQMRNLRRGSVERYAPGGAGTYTTGAYCVAFPPSLTDPIDLYYSPYIQNCTNQTGPWLMDGTMFVPNQTVQIPLAAGTATWSANTNTITVAVNLGTISVGMAVNDAANEGYRNAQLLLQENKVFLQTEVNAFINTEYSSLVYDTSLSFRDVGTLVDAVSGDARFGGNGRSIIAGLSYWNGNTSVLTTNESLACVAAINYLATLAQSIITNTTIASPYQNSVSQTIDNSLSGGSVVSTRITNLFSIITSIITGGPGSEPARVDDLYGLIYPTGLSPNQVNNASTVTNVVDNGGGSFTITLSSPTVSESDDATLYFGYTTVYPYLDADIPDYWSTSTNADRRLDPHGAGGGALVDGNAPSLKSPIQSFVFDAFTQVTQGGHGIHIINNGYAQLVSVFTLFCDQAVTTENGGIASITNSNANFGDLCLVSKGLGKLDFSGIVWNPPYPTNRPNGQFYPLGYWPQRQQMEVFIPNSVNRPHIGLVMEVVPPDTYLDYSSNRVPYVNSEGYPGYLVAASNTGTITTGSYTISGIDTTDIAVGHTLYIRDIYGLEGPYGSTTTYVTTGTQVVDVGFQTVTLDQPILTGGGDVTNPNYLNLYFCGNAYYTVLSSQIDETLSHTGSVATSVIPGEVTTTANAIAYARDLAVQIIANQTATLYQTDVAQIIDPTFNTGGPQGPTIIDRFNDIIGVITGGNPQLEYNINGQFKKTDQSVLDAAKLLEKNRNFIQAQTAAYADTLWPSRYSYNAEICARDTGLIVDAIAQDMLFSGTSQSTFAAIQYWNQGDSNIPNESYQTIQAVKYLKTLAEQVVTNTTGTRYQSTVTQVLTAYTATSVEQSIIGTDFDVITNIMSNGIAGVTDNIVPNSLTSSTNTATVAAFRNLQANKLFLQNEVIAYVNANKNFTYNSTSCGRDTGLLVDAVAFDLLYPTPTDSQSTFAAIQYYNQSGYITNIAGEITTTTNAVNYLKSLAQKVIVNDKTGTRYQTAIAQTTGTAATSAEQTAIANDFTVITNILTGGVANITDTIVPNGAASTSTSILNAYNLLEANKAYLQAETIAYIDATRTGTFVYNEKKCKRDTGIIIDDISRDLYFGGTSQSTFAGLQYWNQNGYTGAIASEITTTTNSINYLSQLAQQIVTNDTSGTRYSGGTQITNPIAAGSSAEAAILAADFSVITDILTNGTAGVTDKIVANGIVASSTQTVINSYNLLAANRAYLQAEVVAWVEAQYPTFAFDSSKCFRDVGYMVDSVSFDLLYGGNRQAIQSGVYYYSFNASSSAIPGEQTQTIAAYNFMSNLIGQIVTNTTATTYQSKVSQVRSLPAATSSEATTLQAKLTNIVNIITNGPSVAPTKTAITKTPSGNANVAKAVAIIEANKAFIQAEVTAWINQTYNIFSYDEDKCSRDVGYMIDSVAFDLVHGGNRQAIQSGVAYYNYTGVNSVGTELPQINAAYARLKSVINTIVTGGTVVRSTSNTSTQVTGLPSATITEANALGAKVDYILSVINGGTGVANTLTPISLTASSDVNVQRAFTILEANRTFITKEIVAYVNDNFANFTYLPSTCARDVGYIVDSVSFDLVYGGNRQATQSGVYYFGHNGSSTVIPGEQTQTVAAYNFIKSLISNIVVGTQIAEPQQDRILQIVSTSTGTSSEITLADSLVDNITNIITNGPSVAPSPTSITLAPSTDTNVVNATKLLEANRDFITAEVIAYIGNTFHTQFNYNEAICARDTGLIIDALAQDLVFGGTSQSTFAGIQYYTQGSTFIPGEITTTTNAINYAKQIAQKIVLNDTTGYRYQSTVTQITTITQATINEVNAISNDFGIITTILNNGIAGVTDTIVPNSLTASTDANIVNAYNNLQANKSYIQNEVVAYVNATSNFQYNNATCFRDVGLIVDSLAFDLLYPTTNNSQSTFAAIQYWNQNGYTGSIGSEITTTTNSIVYLSQLAQKIVVGDKSGTRYQSIISQTTGTNIGLPQDAAAVGNDFGIVLDILSTGPASVTEAIISNGRASNTTSTNNAYNLLLNNLAYMQAEVLAYITTTAPTFAYNTSTCMRDVGYIVDSVAFDLLHGGNRQAIQAGTYYYGYSSTSTAVPNELPQVTAAYNYMKSVIASIVTGQTITPSVGNTVPQVTYMLPAGTTEVSTLNSLIDKIVNVINNGPDTVTAKTPISLVGSTSQTADNAFNLLIANREFIQSEVTSWINNKFCGFNYDEAKCFRDVGYMIDSVSFDLLHGGNKQAVQSGVYYYGHSTSTTVPPTEIPQVTAAYEFISSISSKIVTNTLVAPYQNKVTQVINTGTSASAADIADIKSNLSLITNIISNGPSVAPSPTSIPLTASVTTSTLAAGALLEANRAFIVAETISYINQTYDTGFAYNVANCNRDTGLIVDSLAFDLLFGGESQSAFAGLQYWNQDTYTGNIGTEVTTTTNAIRYLREIAQKVILNETITNSVGNTATQVINLPVGSVAAATSVYNNIDLIANILLNGSAGITDQIIPNGIASTDTGITNAYAILEANKAFLQTEVVARINADNPDFNYNQATCYRDVGYIVDSISFDLLYGGNRQSIQSGVYYYNFNGTETIVKDEMPQVTAAYKYIRDMIPYIITGTLIPQSYQSKVYQNSKNIVSQITDIAVGTGSEVTEIQGSLDLITNIISEGPSVAPSKVPIGLTPNTSANVVNAFNILLANRAFIQAEVLAFVDYSYTYNPPYNKNKCYRDMGSIVDAIIYDLTYGGNYRSINVGNGYYYRQGQYHVITLEQNVLDPTLFIDGATVNFYQQSYISASGYLFEYVGAGTQYGALPQVGTADPVQSKEVVQLNNGKVFFTSTDQNGDFRIGPSLVISQATGVLSGRTFQKSLYAEMTPFVLVIGA
jgi:hypothetical protein